MSSLSSTAQPFASTRSTRSMQTSFEDIPKPKGGQLPSARAVEHHWASWEKQPGPKDADLPAFYLNIIGVGWLLKGLFGLRIVSNP